MKHIVNFSLLIILFSCKKDVIQTEIPFNRVTIYSESFQNDQTWISLPENSVYTPGSECVRIEDNMLKLTFDQPLQNCGCAWVGAKKSIPSINNIPTNKLGVRIKLNKGFFQYMVKQHNSIDQFGNPTKTGSVVSESYFRFNSPSIQMQIANSFNGWFSEDSLVNDDFNRINGIEFEIIYNEGQKLVFINGNKVDNSVANISKGIISNLTGIDFEFTLGHQPEFSPRLDELFIEELEVFTWQGKFRD